MINLFASINRRSAMHRAALFSLIAAPHVACSQNIGKPVKPASALKVAAIKNKFRGISGGELNIDALFSTFTTVIVYPNGEGFYSSIGSFGRNGRTSFYGGAAEGDKLVVPESLRMMRYSADAKFLSTDFFPHFDGSPLFDVIVPVADRISDEALDFVRKTKHCGLRLKLRIHPDTLLVGWDVQHFPKFQADKRDASGVLLTGPKAYPYVGGDFREAEIVNGIAIRKGWYIHPKTGEKIETDF